MGVVVVEGKLAVFGVIVGRPLVTNGICCVVVWKCVNRSSYRFGMVYGMGVHMAEGEVWILRLFAPIGPVVSMA